MAASKFSPAHTLLIVTVCIMTTGLSGCAGVMLGSAATSAVVANDPRTTGTVVEDQSIELKAAKVIHDDPELKDQTNINVTSYNQVVLLTGQSPTASLRKKAVDLVSTIEKVRKVHDEIVISAPTSIMSRTNDTVLTTKVKTKLFANDDLNATHIKVVSEGGVVYLLGIVPEEDATLAAEIASTTGGVQKVVKLFEQK